MTNEPITVLQVDDDIDLGDLCASFLEREGNFRVLTEGDGRGGLDRLANEPIDCIVSDYQMPGMDGLEFLDAVRETHPDLPFILYTGKGSEEIASQAITAGVTDYLQKESGTSHYEILANRVQNAVAQRQSKEEAIETERRLQTIAEHSNDILWKFTADWDELLFINSSYEEIWGRSVAELDDQPLSFLKGIHPDDRQRVTNAMARLSAGESVDIEYRVNAEEDFGRWVWVQGQPVLSETGDVEKAVGFARDITDRKVAEREMESLHDLTNLVLEHTTSTIWSFDLYTDETLSIIGSNEDLLGVSEGEVESAEAFFENALHPEDLPKLSSIHHQLLEGDKKDFTVEFRTHPDIGDIRWIQTTGYIQEDTESPRLVGISTDVTERKQHEDQILRQSNRLEEFAQLLSHDLRNPLTVANGRITLAQEEHPSEHLTTAGAELDRAEKLIDNLLKLARYGHQVHEPESIELRAYGSECWANVNTASATLESESNLTVQADRARLQQLLENLYRNAIDHGGETVTVTIGDLEGGCGFYIEDDGSGISGADRNALFESGYSTSDQGMGYGLAIVEEIVNAHGWHIHAKDGTEGGARFEISIGGGANSLSHPSVNAKS